MTASAQATSGELDELIQRLSGHPDIRVLRRFAPRDHYNQPDGRPLVKGIVIDTETTGMRHGQDRIVELGIVAFEFDPLTGQAFRVLETYNALEDPGFPIPPESTRVHGISDDMVAGKRINDAEVERLVADAVIVIAHNAKFDRPFLEARMKVFERLPWACSFAQMDWNAAEFGSQKLDYLAYRMGFFYEAHRAEADCLALLEVLQFRLPHSGNLVLKEILDNCGTPACKVWARGSRFETKDMLKERAYRWDAEQRCWYRQVPALELEAELDWLKREVYANRPATVDLETDDAHSRFSGRPGVTQPRRL